MLTKGMQLSSGLSKLAASLREMLRLCFWELTSWNMISTKGAFLDKGRCEPLSDGRKWLPPCVPGSILSGTKGALTHVEVSVKWTARMIKSVSVLLFFNFFFGYICLWIGTCPEICYGIIWCANLTSWGQAYVSECWMQCSVWSERKPNQTLFQPR
jgi:hypothetical protein